MTINIYRVECNNGSKYFETGTEAYFYFEKMQKRRLKVELWLLTYQRNKTMFVTQELIAHSDR